MEYVCECRLKMYIMIVTRCTRLYSSMDMSGIMIVMYVIKATVLENVLEWLC